MSNAEVLEIISSSNRHLSEADQHTLADRVTEFWRGAGTRYRYWRAPGERPLDHVVACSRTALAQASVSPAEVDLVVYVGVGRGWLEPAMAVAIQKELQLSNATSFDVLDACASWLRGLQLVHSLMRSGTCRVALLVNCEFNPLDYLRLTFDEVSDVDRFLAGFTIGEAATATVLTASAVDDFHFVFRTFSEYVDLCMLPLPNHADFLRIDGQGSQAPLQFYAHSRQLVATTTRKIFEVFHADGKLRSESYDVVFGHGASERAADLLCRKLQVPFERLIRTHACYGNTISASIPLAMSLGLASGQVQRDMKCLVVIGSAGITVGLASFTF
ncbi:MAG: hypothetical protein M3O61_11255 [Gemmatimonadota bacterium]|nr:hypothetical protein [Gemmatimonadota bacterium]